MENKEIVVGSIYFEDEVIRVKKETLHILGNFQETLSELEEEIKEMKWDGTDRSHVANYTEAVISHQGYFLKYLGKLIYLADLQNRLSDTSEEPVCDT